MSGLMNGDTVTALDGTPVKSREEFRAAVAKIKDGDLVKISLERDGKERIVEHKAAPSIAVTFTLKPDPAATPLEIAIRRGIVSGETAPPAAPPAAESRAVESRPMRKAG
jgi:hypothetical protein